MPGIKRLYEISVQDHRLRYLSLAAQHGSMRAAADLLGVAPSSISRQIGQLERDLKIDLVEKGPHKIKVTEAGQLLIDYHDQRAAEHRELLSRLSELRNTRHNMVRVASGEGLVTQSMMAALAAVAAQHPQVAFELTTATSGEVQRLILSEAAEIGLVLETTDDVRLRVRASISAPIRLISRADMPFSSRPVVSLADIAASRLLMPPASHRLAEIIHSVLRDRALAAEAVIVSNSLGAIVDAVRMGLGVALLPEIVVSREIAGGLLKASPVDCADFDTTRVHLVSRIGRPLSPPALAVMSAFGSALNLPPVPDLKAVGATPRQ